MRFPLKMFVEHIQEVLQNRELQCKKAKTIEKAIQRERERERERDKE